MRSIISITCNLLYHTVVTMYNHILRDQKKNMKFRKIKNRFHSKTAYAAYRIESYGMTKDGVRWAVLKPSGSRVKVDGHGR